MSRPDIPAHFQGHALIVFLCLYGCALIVAAGVLVLCWGAA